MERYIGIDPGKKGSICSINKNKDIEFFDISLQGRELFSLFSDISSSVGCKIMIERVSPMQKGGLSSAWKFGYNVGLIHGILEATGIGYDEVTPKRWQKSTRIIIPSKTKPHQRKRIVAASAIRLYPGADIYGPKGGLLDGRSDALMIAHYCMLSYLYNDSYEK